nr:MAG: hypothetical protein [Marsupenaeus japonicus endogenous nimavirus]
MREKKSYEPKTLRSTALDKVVNLTLLTVYIIYKKKIYHKPGERNSVNFNATINSDVSSVRDYIIDIPSTLIDEYIKLVIRGFVRKRFYGMNRKLYYSIILNIIPLCKVTRICNEWDEEVFNVVSDLTRVLNDKLPNCSSLKELTMTTNPRGKTALKRTLKMFQNFSHLTTLTLIPFRRYASFHWVIGPVVQYCRKLKEFHLVYHGGSLEKSGWGIEDLVQCPELVLLWLFDYSTTAPVGVVDQLQKLLLALKNLKYLFHKQAILAILEHSGKLGLERLNLWLKCDEKYHYFLDEHKEVVDTDKILRLIETCPAIQSLALTEPPPCINTVLKILPNLKILEMTTCRDITPHLCQALQQNHLTALTVIELRQVQEINYLFISTLARTCPNLEVLAISSAAITSDGHLDLPPRQSTAFPHLRALTLIPHHRRHHQRWEVGKRLTYYLLTGACKLNSLHIHYSEPRFHHYNDDDQPTISFLLDILDSLEYLTSLQILLPKFHKSCIVLRELVNGSPIVDRLSLPDYLQIRYNCRCRMTI